MRCWILGLGVLMVLAGCKETVDCIANPLHEVCQDSCRMHPELARCQDGGPDTGTVDAGACGMPCTGETPHCNESTGACAACVLDAHCDDGVCDDGTCVQCAEDADCVSADAARCDTETNTCAPCTDSAQCAGVEGAGVCGDGTCVECTPDTEVDQCGVNSCDPATRTCSDIERGTRRACEACVSDSDCRADHRCLPMEYQGEPREGGYCLKRASAGCAEPFAVLVEGRPSLSGIAEASYCGINESTVSCEAVRGLLDNVQCPGGEDAECPGPGALCRTVGALANRCTYECAGASECLEAPASGHTCDIGDTDGPTYCGG